MASSWSTTMQPLSALFFCLLLAAFSTCNVLSLDTNKTSHEDEAQTMKMIREYLMKVNKPAENTIKSLNGDLIDCVLFHKQPAFDHALLKGKIPMEPPKRSNQLNSTKKFLLWNANGEECPEGTVPIRRTTEEDLLRASSLKRFGLKPTPDTNAVENLNEFAIGVVGPGEYSGAEADLEVWAPHVDQNREYSLSQIWITSNNVDDHNTLEAGWHVYPSLYNDSLPRFFVYWTADGYKKTGCYNLLCPGFVQTSTKIYVGGDITPISTYDGRLFKIVLSIAKDEFTGNWFLTYGSEKEQIGYWPEELLPRLVESASYAEFGGEVRNLAADRTHTTTQMGSGHFPNEGYGKAANVANIDVLDKDGSPDSLDSFHTVVTSKDCYDIVIGDPLSTIDLGVHLFYGGPGRNFNCI